MAPWDPPPRSATVLIPVVNFHKNPVIETLYTNAWANRIIYFSLSTCMLIYSNVLATSVIIILHYNCGIFLK